MHLVGTWACKICFFISPLIRFLSDLYTLCCFTHPDEQHRRCSFLSPAKGWHLDSLQSLHTAFCSSNVTAAASSEKSVQWLKAKLNDWNTLFIHCHRNYWCCHLNPKTTFDKWRGKFDSNKPVYWLKFSKNLIHIFTLSNMLSVKVDRMEKEHLYH